MLNPFRNFYRQNRNLSSYLMHDHPGEDKFTVLAKEAVRISRRRNLLFLELFH